MRMIQISWKTQRSTIRPRKFTNRPNEPREPGPALRRGSKPRKLSKQTMASSTVSPFKLGASQMMGTNPMEGITSLSQVHVRQERAPQHQRPLLGQTYAPSPAPGDTINVLRKKILKQNGEGERITQDLTASLLGTSLSSSSPPRIATSGSNSVKFLDSEKHDRNAMPSWLGAEALERNRLLDCPDPVTPRGQWRKQYWLKTTPWGTDRRVFGGIHHYDVTVKPTVRNYSNSSRVEFIPRVDPPVNSEDLIRQIVHKLEQHCNSTFALTRAFKLFDKDMSNSIDKDEMRAVLITFSIDLSDEELDNLMKDFGAVDSGDGLGHTIKYQDFVTAVETVGGRHPLQINSGRYIMNLKAKYMEDSHGRRLCTPGSRAPVGCAISGCYYPPEKGMPSRSGRKSALW